MKELPNLKELTDEAKEALIVKLWEELQRLQKQLEKKPKKTSKNSSLPPAKGFKAEINNQEEILPSQCKNRQRAKGKKWID